MKKFIFTLMLCVSSCFLFNSCITKAYAETCAETSIYDDDYIQIVIQYGTPYYYGSTLIYYYYDGFYFYPYRYNDMWRFHRYARPLPRPRHHIHGYTTTPHHPHGRPHYNGHFGHGGHNGQHGHSPSTRPNPQPRGGGNNSHVTPHNPSRGGQTMSRPNPQPRGNMSRPSGGVSRPNPSFGRGSVGSSSRPSGGHSGFGGRR